MPQMSPMIWIVFPLIMVSLMLLSLVTLNGELHVMESDSHSGESKIKMVKW